MEPKASRPESLPRVARREHAGKGNVTAASKQFADFHIQANLLLSQLEMNILGKKCK